MWSVHGELVHFWEGEGHCRKPVCPHVARVKYPAATIMYIWYICLILLDTNPEVDVGNRMQRALMNRMCMRAAVRVLYCHTLFKEAFLVVFALSLAISFSLPSLAISLVVANPAVCRFDKFWWPRNLLISSPPAPFYCFLRH